MAKASTLTDIVNLALASLGEKQITNIDADGNTENLMRPLLFEAVRQTQLEIDWQELMVSMSPSQSNDTYERLAGYAIFNLPSNFLDMQHIKTNAHWFLEMGKLITADPAPYITYKKYSEEPSEWTGYLFEMVYKRLAFNSAMAVTQNEGIQSQAGQLYQLAKNDNMMRSANRQRNIATGESGYSWRCRRGRR
tara:strand:+ start:1829 stop:2407 length:579 start_codon:yes stop_codon:yes gene_type:complete